MKVGLACTTIHIPHALKLLRKCSSDVMFFVAGDEESPHSDIINLTGLVPPVHYLLPGEQNKWKCSEAIGWNCIQRRNIAFLEALKWGADVIISWDDDNLPMAPDYFKKFAWVIQLLFNGIKVSGVEGWFDPGSLLIPPTRHRGFPYAKLSGRTASPVVNARVGVTAGLVIGNPDVDAVTRIEKAPDIGSVHILGSTGVVVDLQTWTVFNSQNTAVIRELMPAWFMMPGCGRHDDIYASLIVQRVAREYGYHVHLGQPFAYQHRNEHNLITDLRQEIDGMEDVSRLARFLDALVLPNKTMLADTRIIYEALGATHLVPGSAIQAALLWLDDCEGLGL